MNINDRDSLEVDNFISLLKAHSTLRRRAEEREDDLLLSVSQCFTQININVGRIAAITIITTGATKRKLEQFINVGKKESLLWMAVSYEFVRCVSSILACSLL